MANGIFAYHFVTTLMFAGGGRARPMTHTLSCALAMHDEFLKSGDMRNTKWENYKR